MLWVCDMATLTVYVLYSTAAMSLRYGDTHCLCCECTIWWHSLFRTPLLLWVYDMVTLTVYVVSVRFGDTHCFCSVFHCCCKCTILWHCDTHCLCSVFHCCCECTIWWHSLFMLWVYDMVTLTVSYSTAAMSVRYGDTRCLFRTPLLLWVYDMLTLGVQLWVLYSTAYPVYDMATLRVCETAMLAAYFLYNRAAVGAHYGGSECLLYLCVYL